MKYVFLDIDQVLNSTVNAWKFIDNPELKSNYRFLDGGNWVEVELLNKLIKFVKEEEAKVVGVSSWFAFCSDKDYQGRFELSKIEKVLQLPVYDVSHSTGGGVKRGAGVLSWLREKGYQEGVDSFVVIDDGGERYYAYPTVVVDGKTGLSDKDILLAKEMLLTPMSLNDCESLQNGYRYKETYYYENKKFKQN